MTQRVLDDPYIEPPTPAQWQQMREDYEDWLRAFAAESQHAQNKEPDMKVTNS